MFLENFRKRLEGKKYLKIELEKLKKENLISNYKVRWDRSLKQYKVEYDTIFKKYKEGEVLINNPDFDDSRDEWNYDE